MTVFSGIFDHMRRPKLLIRAARIKASGYRRERDLPRILPPRSAATSEVRVRRLMDIEADLDATRRIGDSTYSITQHVEVLTALIAEATMGVRTGRA